MCPCPTAWGLPALSALGGQSCPGSHGGLCPPQLLEDQAPSRRRRELEAPEPAEPPVTLATAKKAKSEVVLVSGCCGGWGGGPAAPHRHHCACYCLAPTLWLPPDTPFPLVSQSCSKGTARCVWFECPLLQTQHPTTFSIRARVWNSTFIEVSAAPAGDGGARGGDRAGLLPWGQC